MGIEYYAFALFVAGLICIIALLCKVLFSNVKRQNKLLDDRETEVLQLYNRIETIMEEFDDQVKATTEELKLREQEYRAALQNMAAFQLPAELEKKEQVIERVPRSVPFDANRIRAAGEVIERAERMVISEAPVAAQPEVKPAVFQKFFDDSAEAAPPPMPYAEAPINTSRSESILALADEGKTDVEIASTLGITRNEVQLVIGLTR
ncbi:MAG: hypothetical protein FWD44_03965 [Oscillospiraceae bacterium]|nr:hypothetical protein [Oscillospiraceae bacterium]